MPRYARILGEKQVYHVMLRGNNRENIFFGDEDKTKILDTLVEKKKEEAFITGFLESREIEISDLKDSSHKLLMN